MEKEKKESNLFDNFTNLYEVQKTLRFELKPVGSTIDKMRQHLRYDKDLQTFFADQEIEYAYQMLKPFFDSLHEEFITDSMVSETARDVDFSEYLTNYKDKKDLEKAEDVLRKKFSDVFQKAGEKWKEKYSEYKWKKGSKVASGADVLSSQDILQLIKDKYQDDAKIKKNIDEIFKGFFTYFGGFNQNRENYYETSKEAITAVATRIVHENLPKFCDNLIQFECITKKKKDGTTEKIERKFEYINAYKYLKNYGKTTQIKDAKSGEMIEAYDMTEDIFSIYHFSSCLSQSGIEEYNRIIGHYNLLINLYNQAKRSEEKNLKKEEKKFKDLPKFKTLWKQIGCGKKDTLFFSLTHDTKIQAEENKEKYQNPYSVEQILEQAKQAGEKYFQGKSDDGIINTVREFLEYILEKENYDGVYWSKTAMNTISNKYFENYHDLKDRLKEAKVFQKAAKGGGEDIKIPEAIELSGLFSVLDDTTTGWKTSIFLNRILEDEEKKKIIQESQDPSKALLKMIFSDIEENAKQFLDFANTVLSLKEYKSKESKEVIKQWFDYALSVNQMLKYFFVKESKVNKAKGAPIDPVITEALNVLLRADDAEWFKWYDALRNYLTKKPQDDVKENKLKLNFESPNLLGGFVDSHTENSDAGTQYGGYIFRKRNNESGEYDYLLGISQDKKLFRCHLKDEVQKEDESDFERLEYYQTKSTTFFSKQYSINKEKLVGHLFLKIKEKITAKKNLIMEEKELKEINDLEKKLLKSDTPTGLIDSILKQGEFVAIFDDVNFQKLVADTIDEIKGFVKKYEDRAIKLKEVQEKVYQGHIGLKSLTEDLQTIAKEQKKYTYFPVSQKEFKEARNRNTKPLYVFIITNKDLLKKKEIFDQEKEKRGKISEKNLHTLYFEKMLKGNQTTFDIGSGEIFYRKKALKEKKIKKGYKQKPWVIENKRFTENRELETSITEKEKIFQGKSFFLHLSLKLNYTKSDKYKSPHFSSFEDFINAQISSSSNLYFLGIDRGEKHLAYYSLVDQNGEIKDQDTLNMPFIDKDEKPRSIKKDKYFYDAQEKKWKAKEVECWNYNDLLDAMASNRDMARKNWQTIGTIKELKNGYVSQVIRKIVDIAVDKDRKIPSFIVLENLNTGFKRGRQKIEKQVYQKLELALAKKLNFLVDKKAENDQIGSVTKALQLTPPVNNFGDIENKKQFGIMLYTKADYTSQTDPITGWRKSIYLKKGSEKYIKDQIIKSFDDIGFDGKDFYFDYTVDYLDPKDKKSDKKFQKQWRLYSSKNGVNLDRFRGERNNDKNQWISKSQDILKILKNVFETFNLQCSLLSQIKEGKIPKKIDLQYTGWESLRFVIDMIQQIRNTGIEKIDEDFILSPIRDENGNHFDSRNAEENQPLSGDANGAYNIARKGIIMNEHIKIGLTPFIRDEEWDAWLAGKVIWNAWIEKNKKDLYRVKK